MSLGSITRQKQLSDAQFVGDLMGLLKRHRIESAGADGFAQFETCLATKDAFRSQLFTLCTAISHMAEEDLSAEELLALIGRALGLRDGDGEAAIPESMRTSFLSGYNAWSSRAMGDSDIWPPERKPIPAHEPIPFVQPTEPLPEPEYGLRVPGLPTVQEALLMAKKQAPFELPARLAHPPDAHGVPLAGPKSGSPAMSAGSGAPTGNVENLTISELTRLLEEIEQRMSRIKPQVHELTALVEPQGKRPERLARLLEANDAAAAATSPRVPKMGPALVTPQIEVPQTPLDGALLSTEDVENDPFVARHAYLNPKRRRRPSVAPPAPLLASAPIASAPPFIVNAESPAAAASGTAQSAPKVRIIPRPASSMAAQYRSAEASTAEEPGSYRILVHIAIGVLAAVILVSIPLAGMMVYRSSHPHYEYPDLKPAVESGTDPTIAAPQGTDQPASSAGQDQAGAPAAKAATGKSGIGARRSTKRKPPPPVAVWPPPPPK